MGYEYKINNVDLKISKDELGYQEVLDDFRNAQIIRIITYNITNSSKDILFEKLSELKGVDIQFITNIPSRFEWYATSKKGDYLRRTAQSNIEIYLDKLNPKRYDNIVPFFNFNNHAKIIGTENVVYIGSQNFSVASKNNYEAGIITRDKEFIKNLYDSFFEELKQNSEPYFKDGYNEARLFIASIRSRLTNHYNNICENLFKEYKGRLVFISDQTFIGVNDLYELTYDLYELEEMKKVIENIDIEDNRMEELYKNIVKIVNEIDGEEIINLIEEDSKLYNYINYDYEREYDRAFEEYSIEACEENLEYYVEQASDDARDVLLNVCLYAEKDIFKLKDKLNVIVLQLDEVLNIVEEYYNFAINEVVDNTRSGVKYNEV